MKRRRRDPSDDTPDRRSSGEHVRDLLDVIGSDLLDFGQLIIAGHEDDDGGGRTRRPARCSVTGTTASTRPARPCGRRSPTTGGTAPDRAPTPIRTPGNSSGPRAMADADREVHRVLFREAIQIKLRRDTLDDQSNFLAKTSYATFPLQFIPRVRRSGQAGDRERGVAGRASTLAPNELYQLHSETAANAAELQQAIGRYAGVADGAELPGVGVDFAPPAALPGRRHACELYSDPNGQRIGERRGRLRRQCAAVRSRPARCPGGLTRDDARCACGDARCWLAADCPARSHLRRPSPHPASAAPVRSAPWRARSAGLPVAGGADRGTARCPAGSSR